MDGSGDDYGNALNDDDDDDEGKCYPGYVY